MRFQRNTRSSLFLIELIIAILFFQYLAVFFPGFLAPATIIGHILIAVATFFTVVSGLIYIRDNRDVVKG